MPIEFRIDHSRRLVIAEARGRLTYQEVFNYQREVWSRAEVSGYDELADMTRVDHMVVPSTEQLKALVAQAASMDLPGIATKCAVVTTDELAFDLAGFFKVYRELDPRSTKTVNIFKSMDEAVGWLGVEGVLE